MVREAFNVGIAFTLCGIALGGLVGLSVSPVVASVAAALVGIAAGVLGPSLPLPRTNLTASEDTGTGPTRTRGQRTQLRHRTVALSALCAGLIVSLPFAIWARTHDWLSKSADQEAQEILKLQVEYNPTIERVVVLQRYGIDIAGNTPTDSTVVEALHTLVKADADQRNADQCDHLAAVVKANESSAAMINSFIQAGDPWRAAAASAKALTPTQQVQFLRQFFNRQCLK